MAKYDIQPVNFEVDNARIAIVAARFNHEIVNRLLHACIETLSQYGVPDDSLTVVRVPGAFELPLAAHRLASDKTIEAVITLGAVVRGGTPHFDYVCNECASGVSRVALDLGKPIVFGVLTTDDMTQALDRAGGAQGNKGEEAALAALEMITVLRALPRP